MRLLRTLGNSPRRRTILLGLLVAGFIAFLLIAPPVWEYSNSPQFCGTTCHTMPPEFSTYLVSPHARVPCVDCHIGRGLLIEQFTRKTGHMRLIFSTLTNNYEYPIFVSTLRPARETCELCHYPQKFSDDSLRVLNRYSNDAQNAPYQVFLLMHTGGGSHREGLGRGIHWHIENLIEFIATDDHEQEIPWVRVTTVEGEVDEYVAEDATIDTENLEQYEIQEMDCITCHNRISHLIETPRNLVDTALYRGDLPSDIPAIREQAIALLEEHSLPQAEGVHVSEVPQLIAQQAPALADGNVSFASLEDFYRQNYPEFYSENSDQVAEAIAVLEEIYASNTYPQQLLDWNTHPNNIGHRDWPGCFRCHDGRHFNAEGEAIRLECNLCHSIPLVVRPGEIEPALPVTTGIEPSSHLDSTWISRHHNEIDRTCANCHTVADPGGTSDTSFCSNSQCHGVEWRFGGFDAPALAVELGMLLGEPEETPVAGLAADQPVTYQTLQPILESRCGSCHGSAPSAGLRLTDYESLMEGSRDGPVVVPNEPDESVIVQVLNEGHFARLNDEEMALLRQWIATGAQPGEAEAAGPITYQTLQPAFESLCGDCHSGSSPSAGLRVTDYESLMEGGRDGPVILPNQPEESLIVQVLSEGHFARFSDEQMVQLREWIAAGAPEGDGEGGAEAAPATPTPYIDFGEE